MSKNEVNNRLEYLAKQYHVFDNIDDIIIADGMAVTEISDDSGGYSVIVDDPSDENSKSMVYISVLLFSIFIKVDPTDNHQCVQWMLRVWVNMVRSGVGVYECLRFIHEDLIRFKEYVIVFETNKNKDKFKKLCSGNRYLSDVKDFKDINSYSSISKLFEAVDPFIEKDHSGLRGMIDKYIDSGQGYIPYSDREYMIYVPLTVSASEIFSSFTSWCTSAKGNGMFRSYTSNNKRGDGSDSRLYVIIPKVFFDGFTDIIYQIHFETGQFMTRGNSYISEQSVWSLGDGVRRFIVDELLLCIQLGGKARYFNFAEKYGFTEITFESMDSGVKEIVFIDSGVGVIPDGVSRLVDVEHMVVVNCGLRKISDGIGKLKNLKVLSINNNPITSLPSGLCGLVSLEYLSIVGCSLTILPESLRVLDVSNGGKLKFVACDGGLKDEVRRVLPNAMILS